MSGVGDLNACAECGYTTVNFAEFALHAEQHEIEQHESQQKAANLYRSPPDWEDLDEELEEEEENVSRVSPAPALTANLGVQGATPNTKSSPKAIHSCPHCNFTTYMSQHMKSHLEAHERHQGQMYQCDICQMQFSQKANMHRHRMRHSGVKPYQCRYCLKRFFRKDQMQEHSMTHIKTGADFDCPVAFCDMQFSQHSALRTHLDEFHSIAASSPASCKRCALLFANSRRLLLHYQTKHDDGEHANSIPSPSSVNGKTDNNNHTTPPKRRRTAASKTPKKESITNVLPQSPNFDQSNTSSYSMTSEELLMSLNNASNTLFTIQELKQEANMNLWTAQTNGSSTEDQSHSPSDSGSSNTEPKEQQECLNCGLIFMDQTLYLLHKGLHSDSDPWKCNLCGQACGDKYMFHTHIISVDHS